MTKQNELNKLQKENKKLIKRISVLIVENIQDKAKGLELSNLIEDLIENELQQESMCNE